jgi:alpha-N-acetylglucosamine transferase
LFFTEEMMERWIKLRSYDILRASDNVAPVDTSQVRLTQWLALRRIRTTLFVATFLITMALSIHFIDLTNISHAVKQATKQSSPPSESTSLSEATTPSESTDKTEDLVTWSDFAYIQYVTNENYLCNSLMILESLHRLQSKADRVMMYPQEWKIAEGIETGTETGTQLETSSRLLIQARDEYNTKLIPISVQHLAKGDPTWQDSFTKLLAFNQTQYKRLISLDSDATVKQVRSTTSKPISPVVDLSNSTWMNYFSHPPLL